MSYWRFAAMIATSTVVMFGLMYLNTFALEHVFWSETRAWMALLMGATMAIIMLGYMLAMYRNPALNMAIFAAAVIAFGGSLWLVRSQVTVNGKEFMEAMIPHHSIAIMTSSRAGISDPRVRKLADEIIGAQEREISEMKYLIAQLDAGEGGTGPAAAPEAPAQVVDAEEAIAGAQRATLDPQKLTEDEIGAVLGDANFCGFHYTSAGETVFALSPGGEDAAVVKVNGNLVALAPVSAQGDLVYEAGPMRVTLSGEEQAQGWDANRDDATMVFEIGDDLRAGFGGYYRCAG